MSAPGPRTRKARTIARLIWHYVELTIALSAGMMLLAPVWSAVLPKVSRVDVAVLVMAADMAAGVAAWMLVRRHRRPYVAEMILAVVAPFLVLLVPFWFGVVPGTVVMNAGHAAMFVLMALVMVRRRREHEHVRRFRVRITGRWAGRAAVVLTALAIPGAVSAVNTVGKFGAQYEARAETVSAQPVRKTHDPAKPTVALLTGSKGANVADLLGPYEVLAGTGRFNTYVVSAGPRLIPLTGGLDLVPDMTFGELTRLLADRHDELDAVVVPALQPPAPAEHDAVTTWLRRQSAADALIVSVCRGARTLAETGLLDGRTATSHWLRLAGLKNDFPRVSWVDGRRYVDEGPIITTAGILSGIDGALRITERLTDAATARQAAQNVHWRHYSPGASARLPKSALEPPDVVVALNASYSRGTIGVQLTEGVGELELASAFVSYTEEAMVGRTISIGNNPIHSKHGLTFIPRSPLADAGDLDRLLVPGLDAARRHTAGPHAEYLHTTEEFAFDPVLRDIARTYDLQTARWTAKTMEYPQTDLNVTGGSWPWLNTLAPLALALLGALAAGVVVRRIRARSRTAGPRPLAAPSAEPTPPGK
ncbi:DJ-1/PfpI family protein [Streptosporangium sandarakinum]|uniref:DJ-1/PfpI family protein n=1 Tax=Streptosporangium sandarakinum TaxID=1260955 RepID=UPI00342C1734